MLPRIFCLVGPGDDPALLEELATVGVDGFQVRAKDASSRELMALTETVIDAVRPLGAVVVVNDRLAVALASGADGVHLGAKDLRVREARRVAPELLIGATCRDRAQVELARAAGADYAGFGPLFATTSKTGLPAPLGPSALTAAAGSLPLVGIGGVGPGNAARVVAAGAHGVAVIAAIWEAPDPVAAAQALVEAVS